MKLPQLIPENRMSFPTYLADPMPVPSLTSSLVRSLLSTAPRKVWQNTQRLNPNFKAVQDGKFDLGSAAHALFTGSGEPIAVIDAKAFNTTEAKAQRQAAYDAGRTPILKHNMPRVDAMACAALDQFRDNVDIGKFFKPPLSEALLREASIFWKEDGVMHRCRPDFYHHGENVIIHYKTTGVSIAPSELARYAANSGWYLTAAHYGAGAKALTGEYPRQFFAVQETDEPHLGLVAELDNIFFETAQMRRARAVTIWARCLRENVWPGYPTRTVKLECPEWLERNLVADKDAETEATRGGGDLLDYARRWQAPIDWQDVGKSELVE